MHKIKSLHWIRRAILDRLGFGAKAWQREPQVVKPAVTDPTSTEQISEEDSEIELERLKQLIENRKRVAIKTDISHHLWGLYKNHFHAETARPPDPSVQDGEWYELKTLRSSNRDGLNEVEFELKGVRYKFVDDEERHGWADKIKMFSLFLYDGAGHCLIEIPMKVRIDRWGRNYSIAVGGPNAFLPGDWIQDFINVKLKHQSLRNREIRAQKHKERLSEIEELKERFGLWE